MAEGIHTEARESTLVATIDSGKGNPITFEVIDGLLAALDEVESSSDLNALAVVGQPGLLSGGFDLAVMRGDDPDGPARLLHRGGELCTRLYGASVPVAVGATGHAVAAGAFLLLAADGRVGIDGEVRIGLPEVAIGIELPAWSVILVEERLNPGQRVHAVLSGTFDGPGAQRAGFLDVLVPAEEVVDATIAEAKRLSELDQPTFRATRTAMRSPALGRLQASLSR